MGSLSQAIDCGLLCIAEFSPQSMLLLWGRHHLVFKALGSVIQWDYHWCCMHRPANSFTKRLYSKRNTICRMHSEICGLTRNKGSRGGSALVKLLSYLQKGTSGGSKEFWKSSADATATISIEYTVAYQRCWCASRHQEGCIFFLLAVHCRPFCMQDCKLSSIVSGANFCRRRICTENDFSIE